MKPFTTIASSVFALVAFMHVLRLFLGWEVTVNGAAIPMSVSALGLAIAGLLAFMLWRKSDSIKSANTLVASVASLGSQFGGATPTGINGINHAVVQFRDLASQHVRTASNYSV